MSASRGERAELATERRNRESFERSLASLESTLDRPQSDRGEVRRYVEPARRGSGVTWN